MGPRRARAAVSGGPGGRSSWTGASSLSPAQVQGTNDSSVASKCSAAARGYVQDGFLRCFVSKTRRRAPLVHRGYYVRAQAVDRCVRGFLLQSQGCPQRQILSLGAGFDSLYFRLKTAGLLSRTVVYEVDFPSVVSRKAALIRGTKDLAIVVGGAGGQESGAMSFVGEDYKLLGVDLSELSQLEKALKEAGLDSGVPTMFLAEVVLTYMENSRSDALIRWAAQHFCQAQFVLYEQMHPEDPFGHIMQQHFSRLNSALHGLAQYPDCEAQRRRFLQQGWTECFIVDMNQFYTLCIPAEERQRVQALEPFDEYEEWHLKCSHYFILVASKGMELTWTSVLSSLAAPAPGNAPTTTGSIRASMCMIDSEAAGLKRFAHRSVLIGPHLVLTTGGFGEQDGRHCRLRELHLLVRHKHSWRAGCVTVEEPSSAWGGRLYHTVTRLSENRALVMGGRMSPTSTVLGALWLEFHKSSSASDPDGIVAQFKRLQLAEDLVSQRWRHTTTEVTCQGQKYLFIYGGCSAVWPVLGDWYFLHVVELSCTQVPVQGVVPDGRHSHSACAWAGGALIAGGLGAAEQLLGSVLFLRPTESGFQWQTLETCPPLVPRYSHTAHVHDGKLLLVGGVWLLAPSVPGVAVVDLMTGATVEYQIDVEAVEWPLLLHNHSSILLPEEKELLLIGGGGNCFSFGTHLNPQPVCLDLCDILTS
ncbi:PREDICTED: tRNA wybutosine-synthesizing protein 4 [Gavialis gangeticus]|uniref:tRNA wybutosine-synthesizing protein 4 n=1 Tax=Gavialis gangeticus TaxID=94835 RepID=UPI00092EA7E3|nr:PREDICTED: tRNA wybutosine-synthesizing protein 4 [Gavialis gangeticus]